MALFNVFRDFTDGLTRGFGLYFSERNDFVERTVLRAPTPRKPR